MIRFSIQNGNLKKGKMIELINSSLLFDNLPFILTFIKTHSNDTMENILTIEFESIYSDIKEAENEDLTYEFIADLKKEELIIYQMQKKQLMITFQEIRKESMDILMHKLYRSYLSYPFN